MVRRGKKSHRAEAVGLVQNGRVGEVLEFSPKEFLFLVNLLKTGRSGNAGPTFHLIVRVWAEW